MAASCQNRSICIMKSTFNTKWTASKQPRKQRKYTANAPLHIRHKFLSAQLSKELRKKHNKKNIPLRKGDEVLIMRGSHKKKKAKVISINLTKSKVVLEGIQQTKRDGSKVAIPFHPSNLQIQTLTLDDKKRIKALTGKEVSSPKSQEPTVLDDHQGSKSSGTLRREASQSSDEKARSKSESDLKKDSQPNKKDSLNNKSSSQTKTREKKQNGPPKKTNNN